MAYKRSRKFYSKTSAKWSHENKGCILTFQNAPVNTLYQGGAVVVPSVSTQGTRTVGNFVITIPVSEDRNYIWALVYVPQGTTASNLFSTTQTVEGSLYEPNQYVLASGINDGNAGPIRIRTRMKRTLHSGDFISLIIATSTNLAGQSSNALVSYSIKYN